MNRVTFKKSTSANPFLMKPGEWVPAILNGKKSAWIKPIDWNVFGSIEKHEIDQNGEVNPSVMLTHADKTFHEYIILENW